MQNSNNKEKTVSESAELMNVSERSIHQARQVDRDGIPELGKKVASGQVRVSTAADISKLPASEQLAILKKEDPQAVQQAAKKNRATLPGNPQKLSGHHFTGRFGKGQSAECIGFHDANIAAPQYPDNPRVL